MSDWLQNMGKTPENLDWVEEERARAVKEVKRLEGEERQRQQQERALLPRVQQLEVEQGKTIHTLNLFLQLIKRTDAEFDALQAEKKSLEERILKLESGSASAERVHESLELSHVNKTKNEEIQRQFDGIKKRMANVESKVSKAQAKDDAPPWPGTSPTLK